MFGDAHWAPYRGDKQESRYRHWLAEQSGRRIGVIEFGAGTAIPTVRHESESVAAISSTPLVRVNPREPEGAGAVVSLPIGAMEAIERIDRLLTF